MGVLPAGLLESFGGASEVGAEKALQGAAPCEDGGSIVPILLQEPLRPLEIVLAEVCAQQEVADALVVIGIQFEEGFVMFDGLGNLAVRVQGFGQKLTSAHVRSSFEDAPEVPFVFLEERCT